MKKSSVTILLFAIFLVGIEANAMPQAGFLEFQTPYVPPINQLNAAQNQMVEVIRLLSSGEEITVVQKKMSFQTKIALVPGRFKLRLSDMESGIFKIESGETMVLKVGYLLIHDYERAQGMPPRVFSSSGEEIIFERNDEKEPLPVRTNLVYYVLPDRYAIWYLDKYFTADIIADSDDQDLKEQLTAFVKPVGGLSLAYLGYSAISGQSDYLGAVSLRDHYRSRQCLARLIGPFMALPEGEYEIELNGIHKRVSVFSDKETQLKTGRLSVDAPFGMAYQITSAEGEKIKSLKSCYPPNSDPDDPYKEHFSGSTSIELFEGNYALLIQGEKIDFIIEAGKITRQFF